MLAKPTNTSQLGFFATLADQLDQKHSLFLLITKSAKEAAQFTYQTSDNNILKIIPILF